MAPRCADDSRTPIVAMAAPAALLAISLGLGLVSPAYFTEFLDSALAGLACEGAPMTRTVRDRSAFLETSNGAASGSPPSRCWRCRVPRAP